MIHWCNLCFDQMIGEFLTGYIRNYRELRSQRSSPDLWHRGLAATEFANLEPPLPDLLRQLNSADRHAGRGEALQAHHCSNPMLYTSVVLFDSVIQILTRPRVHTFGQFAIFLHDVSGERLFNGSSAVEAPLVFPLRLRPRVFRSQRKG